MQIAAPKNNSCPQCDTGRMLCYSTRVDRETKSLVDNHRAAHIIIKGLGMSIHVCPSCYESGLVTFTDGTGQPRVRCSKCDYTSTEFKAIERSYGLQTIIDLRAEAKGLIARGLSLVDACEIVGLPTRHYTPSSLSIEYIPTPDEILAITTGIRSGELVFTERHTRNIDQAEKAAEMRERRIARRIELAGMLPDDSCPVPDFLYSAERTR